jgi:hypothetical protein
MYGTIARVRVKTGMDNQFLQIGKQYAKEPPKGMVFEHVYRSDDDPRVYWMVVGFESKAAYVANANAPEQHERYLKLRALLEADPEWHDGEIVDSFSIS